MPGLVMVKVVVSTVAPEGVGVREKLLKSRFCGA